jgi:hypothetical protein
MDWIPDETGPIRIRLIRFILSRTLNATARKTVRLPRNLGSGFRSCSRWGRL